MASISSLASGWLTSSPTISAGTGNDIRIAIKNASGVSGTTASWCFMGSI